jgi:hypothetical protein
MSNGKTPQQVIDFYKEAIGRIDALPGVTKTAFGDTVPWRDASRRQIQIGPLKRRYHRNQASVTAAGIQNSGRLLRTNSPIGEWLGDVASTSICRLPHDQAQE